MRSASLNWLQPAFEARILLARLPLPHSKSYTDFMPAVHNNREQAVSNDSVSDCNSKCTY